MSSPIPLQWSLPLDRPHNGIPIANGTQGLMVWGSDSINITIAHEGFWDRRGGNSFLSQATFQKVKSFLLADDEVGLKNMFGVSSKHDSPQRPHQIGGGRLEIPLPEGWSVASAHLHPMSAKITIGIHNGNEQADVQIRQCVTRNRAVIDLPSVLKDQQPNLLPSWHWIEEVLSSVRCEPPEQWQNQTELGFCQTLPEDDPLAVRVHVTLEHLEIATDVGPTAKESTQDLLEEDLTTLLGETDTWWEDYWKSVPSVQLPDPLLQELVIYGLYHQACCTPPQGVACTLQGPLMECEKLPPWSNDYHFNINLQMIYTPALATNRATHFDPLWNMISEWLPGLKQGGQRFFEDNDALMLPHAVDDRCQVVGSFWTGTIDHACTAWMALLCVDYWRYSGDKEILSSVGWPLLKGAWAGYRSMLEEKGDHLELPVSVSPEYKGSSMDAWGKSSSFQLAAFHAVVRELPNIARELGEPINPEWADVSKRVPHYTSETLARTNEFPQQTQERIVLWEGQDLEDSHRHHSHLAGITPFRTLRPDGEHTEVLRNSLHWWVRQGTGGWSGWSIPWASMIHARCDQPDAAVEKLHSWNRNFTNRGRASLHDADFPGFTTLSSSPERPDDIMQLDGRFGALSAVLELLVQDWNDEIRVLPSLPRNWNDLSFDGILAPGGFLIGADVKDGQIQQVRVTSQRGGPLRIRIGKGPRKQFETQPEETRIVL